MKSNHHISTVKWLSKEHRAFIWLTQTEPIFKGLLNKLFLLFLPLIPRSKIIVVKQDTKVIGGKALSSFFMTAWKHQQDDDRKEMFQYFKKHQYLYSCFAVIEKEHRSKGYFTQLLTTIKEPHFFITKEKAIEDLAIKHGAEYFLTKKGNKIPNRTNKGKTHYLYKPNKLIS